MKTIIFLLLMILLASCGGGKSSSTSSVIETIEQQQIDCLEHALGWIKNPPENRSQALKQLSQSNFGECASEEAMDLYIDRIMLAHPQLTF